MGYWVRQSEPNVEADAIRFRLRVDGSIVAAHGRTERVFGSGAAEVVGNRFWHFFHEPGTVRGLLRIAAGGVPASCLARAIGPPAKPVRIEAGPVPPGGMNVIVRLTAFEAGTRDPLSPTPLSRDLLASLSHEIGSPLTGVTTNLFLIRRHLLREDASLPLLQTISRFSDAAMSEAGRLERLVKNLRAWSPTVAREHRPGRLDLIVADEVDAFESLQPLHCVERDIVTVDDLPLDEGHVRLVVSNLLANACEAQPTGGTVRIRVRAQDGGALLRVEDDGPGIPPIVSAQMYDPFFTTKRDGLGLGLAVVRKVARLHQGSLRSKSRAGEGACFLVWFPPASALTPQYRRVESPVDPYVT